jgi:hypothetical protein
MPLKHRCCHGNWGCCSVYLCSSSTRAFATTVPTSLWSTTSLLIWIVAFTISGDACAEPDTLQGAVKYLSRFCGPGEASACVCILARRLGPRRFWSPRSRQGQRGRACPCQVTRHSCHWKVPFAKWGAGPRVARAETATAHANSHGNARLDQAGQTKSVLLLPSGMVAARAASMVMQDVSCAFAEVSVRAGWSVRPRWLPN